MMDLFRPVDPSQLTKRDADIQHFSDGRTVTGREEKLRREKAADNLCQYEKRKAARAAGRL